MKPNFSFDLIIFCIFRYAEIVGNIMKLVLSSLIQKNDVATEDKFWKSVIRTFNYDAKVQLALNVLDGISDFYTILAKDGSRNGITAQKLILQAIAGSKVREASQISLLSGFIGARRMSLHHEFENQSKIEDQQKLTPFVEMLRRKSPQGARFIPEKTKIDVIAFYESDDVSDIMKGHNNIYKGFNNKVENEA